MEIRLFNLIIRIYRFDLIIFFSDREPQKYCPSLSNRNSHSLYLMLHFLLPQKPREHSEPGLFCPHLICHFWCLAATQNKQFNKYPKILFFFQKGMGRWEGFSLAVLADLAWSDTERKQWRYIALVFNKSLNTDLMSGLELWTAPENKFVLKFLWNIFSCARTLIWAGAHFTGRTVAPSSGWLFRQ